MTQSPDQIIAQIREALEAGPTPGEWTVNGQKSLRGPNGEYIAKANWRNGMKDAPFIAACNPHNIAVLLAELDSLREGKWAVKHVDTMNDMASLAVALKAAEAERDALRKALKPFSRVAGEMFARNWNAKQIVVALDTPEDSHRVTACDFFRARTLLSGDNHEHHE
jgi:hypothetical protein